jgi:hypothetical protein
MDKPSLVNETNLPLEILGFEANTARDVFVPTKALDTALLDSLDANGYVKASNIMLTDGRTVDGWLKR